MSAMSSETVDVFRLDSRTDEDEICSACFGIRVISFMNHYLVSNMCSWLLVAQKHDLAHLHAGITGWWGHAILINATAEPTASAPRVPIGRRALVASAHAYRPLEVGRSQVAAESRLRIAEGHSVRQFCSMPSLSTPRRWSSRWLSTCDRRWLMGKRRSCMFCRITAPDKRHTRL